MKLSFDPSISLPFSISRLSLAALQSLLSLASNRIPDQKRFPYSVINNNDIYLCMAHYLFMAKAQFFTIKIYGSPHL